MRITHRVTVRADASLRRELADLGIVVQEGLASFDVTESDPNWPQIAAFIARQKPLDIVSTTWTPQELKAASRIVLSANGQFGYPMPDGDNGYLEATYDLRDYCPNCGIGLVQKAPFRFRAEPKWGRRCLLQLNWVFDEYFVTPECWERVFRPFGIQTMPAVKHSTGTPLQTVVQLVVDRIAQPPLEMDNHPYRLCPRCERRKYLPVVRACFPSFQSAAGETSMLKTQEYFGDGAKAFREVIISQKLYMAILELKAFGAAFTPQCEAS